MNVIVSVKMWTLMLQTVLLASCQRIHGAHTKRGASAYSVQEMNQEFSSPGASDPANYAPWANSDSPSSYMPSSPSSYSPSDSDSSSSSSSSSSASSSSSGSFFGRGLPYMGSNFPTSSSGFPGFSGSFPGSFPGSNSFPGGSSFSGRFSGDFSKEPSKPSDGPGDFNNDEGPGFTGIQGELIDEHNSNVYDYKPPRGKDINDLPHILPPGGKSIEQLQEEADFRLKKLFFEAKVNQKSVQEKINKLKENYGYGTFGFDGYKSPIKYGPINLGTHNAIDLGTSIDYNRLKGHPGKLKLPVQTVRVTKTLGIHVPQPYPVKQEIPVPAPYPVIQHVPAPHHDHHSFSGGSSSSYQPNHEIVEQYSGTYSSEYSGNGGKSSYPGPPSSISKLVRYHENLPRGPVKGFPSSYKSSSSSYSSFQPSKSYPSIGHSSSPNHYLMPPSPGSSSFGYDSHHYSS